MVGGGPWPYKEKGGKRVCEGDREKEGEIKRGRREEDRRRELQPPTRERESLGQSPPTPTALASKMDWSGFWAQLSESIVPEPLQCNESQSWSKEHWQQLEPVELDSGSEPTSAKSRLSFSKELNTDPQTWTCKCYPVRTRTSLTVTVFSENRKWLSLIGLASLESLTSSWPRFDQGHINHVSQRCVPEPRPKPATLAA